MEKICVAEIVYKTGRTERLYGKFKKDGTPYASFLKQIEEFRAFPTVVKVTVGVEEGRINA